MSDAKQTHTYILNPLAYTLPLLHAAHHLSTVLGIFLGHVSSTEITISDAIPLIHHYSSLSPTTEVGLEMAEEYASEKGSRIVGLYMANESGTAMGRVGEMVLAAVKERFDGAFGMVVGI